MVETETKTKTWKKFETKTWDQDLKKFSRPRSRLGEFVRDRDETSRPEILEAKLIRFDYWQPFSLFFLKQTASSNTVERSWTKKRTWATSYLQAHEEMTA